MTTHKPVCPALRRAVAQEAKEGGVMTVEDSLKACDRIVCWPRWCYWEKSRAEWQVREERYHSDSGIIYCCPSLTDALAHMLDTRIR